MIQKTARFARKLARMALEGPNSAAAHRREWTNARPPPGQSSTPTALREESAPPAQGEVLRTDHLAACRRRRGSPPDPRPTEGGKSASPGRRERNATIQFEQSTFRSGHRRRRGVTECSIEQVFDSHLYGDLVGGS
jgi:hypothetical protein